MTQTATLTELTKRTFFEMMKDVATSIPGHVIAFDPVKQLAQIQIGVIRKDVKGVRFEPPPLIEVPVYFAGGSQFFMEHQIDPLDEGVILFSQRCIDGWSTTGGIANNPIMRFHDLNDAMFLPGLRSQPNVISDFSNNGVRIRNNDGSQYFWLKSDKTIEAVNGAGNFTMLPDGTVNINGATIAPDGTITSPTSVGAPTVAADTSLTVNGKEQANHTHLPGTYQAGGDNVTGNSGTQP